MLPREHPGVYREKLWPAWWVFVATPLVIPASLLVFLPISVDAGYVSAAVLYGAIVVTLVATTPLIEVTDGMLRAGRARIERSFVGAVSAHDGADAFAELSAADREARSCSFSARRRSISAYAAASSAPLSGAE